MDLEEMIAFYTVLSAAPLAVQTKDAGETLKAFGNCSLAFHPESQAIDWFTTVPHAQHDALRTARK